MNGKIRTGLFLGFTAAALAMTGCIVDNGGGPSNTGSCADNRFVSVTWDIVKNSTGAPLSCDQAGATDVNLYLGSTTYNFPCNSFPSSDGTYGSSTSSGIPEGPYPTSLQLLGPNGEVLSDTAVASGVQTVTVLHCASTTLPLVEFGAP